MNIKLYFTKLWRVGNRDLFTSDSEAEGTAHPHGRRHLGIIEGPQ